MSRFAAVLARAFVALASFAACGRDGDSDQQPAIPICEVRFAAPAGFAPSETFEEPYEDRVGVRLGFVDEGRREFHVIAGIPGEFGEGLPAAGEITLIGGHTGHVIGRGEVWVVRWDEGDLCDPRAVLANGFDRDAFDAVLVDAGLVAPG